MHLQYENPVTCDEQLILVDGVEYINNPAQTGIVVGDMQSARTWANMIFKKDFAEEIATVEEL